MSRGRKFLEIAISMGFMGVAIAVLIEIHDLPPGLIDPLGSAPVPRWTASILFLLSLVMLVRILLPTADKPAIDHSSDEGMTQDNIAERPGAAIGVIILTIVYAAVFASRTVGFSVMTAIFVFALVVFLASDKRQGLWMGLLLGIIVGFGCEYLFTQIFVVDLPTWR